MKSNEEGTSKLVTHKRKKLFNREEFLKEFARKVDNYISPPMSSNYSTNLTISIETAANDNNSSSSHHSDHNSNEPKSSSPNNACNSGPSFSRIGSNETACFKGDLIHIKIVKHSIYQNEV